MSHPGPLIDVARADDVPAILELERTGFPPPSRWIAASWLPEIEGADHYAPAARDQGVLCGVAAFQLVADVADLNRVVVHPDHRGRGVGRALLRSGMRWAADRGAERMLLEVEWANEPALALYRALGFVEISHRVNYYGVNRDALVMQREVGAMKELVE